MTETTFIRNHFFTGKILTAAELELEQNYFRNKLKLHNSALHGFGIVAGLEVSQGRENKLIVSPGLAFDCEGNEILINERVVQSLPDQKSGSLVYLTLRYRELPTNPVPVIGGEEDLCEHGSITETYALGFENTNPTQNHRHLRGRWQACGEAHALAIARLRSASGQWRVDRRLRRPIVK